MACKYTINGKEDSLVDEFFKTIEDNGKNTTSQDLYNVLIEQGVLSDQEIAVGNGLSVYVPNVELEELNEIIDNLNTVYAEYFSNTFLPGVPVAGLKIVNNEDFKGATIEFVDQVVSNSVLVDRFSNEAVTGTAPKNEIPQNIQAKINLAVKKLKSSRNWEIDSETNKYFRVVDGVKEFAERVTSFVKGKKETLELYGAQKKAAARGTIIDEMLRRAVDAYNIDQVYPTVEEFMEIYKNHELKNSTDVFTPDFIKSIHKLFTEDILPKFNNDFTLLADIPTLSGVIKQTLVAGTVDLIGYTSKGDFIIIDLKTSTTNRREQYKGNDPYDYQMNDALQLVAYQELFRQITGILPGIAILPVQITFEKDIQVFKEVISNRGPKGEILLENKFIDAAKRKLKLTQNQRRKNLTAKEINRNKIFNLKAKTDKTYEDIKIVLQTQLEKLNRQSKPDEEAIEKAKSILRDLNKVEEGNDIIEDYLSFVEYLADLANESIKLFEDVQDYYVENLDTLTQDEKFDLMNKIVQIKTNLDSFYSSKGDQNIIDKLENRVKDLEGSSGDILDILQEVGVAFRELDKDYLATGIPILADTLLSLAPIKVNQEIDANIALIKESIAQGKPRFIGLDRNDSRVPNFFSISGVKSTFSTKAQLEISRINIQQLESRKIGRQEIIRDLTETHKDGSIFSAYVDPLVYANGTVLQLIAQMVKSSLVGSSERTRNTLYELNEPFEQYRSYMSSLGVSEDNTSKFHEPMYETVELVVTDIDGNKQKSQVLSFVSDIDRNKWYAAKNKAVSDLRTQYGYPKNATNAAIRKFFKSEDGRNYRKELAIWWKENSEPIEGAQEFLNSLDRELESLRADLNIAYKKGDYVAISEIYNQITKLNIDRNKIYSNGTFVGRMARPKMSLYANEKFKNMPPQVRAYYDTLLEIYKQKQKITGKTGLFKDSWMDYSLIVPSIESNAVDDVIENHGFIDATKKLISRSTQAQVTDTEFLRLVDSNNEQFKLIPLYFVNRVESNSVSKNLTNSIVMFADMAHRFEAKSQIHGAVNLAHLAIQGRKVKELAPVVGLNLNYYGNKIAAKLGIQRDDYIEGGNAAIQLKSFLDNVYYGETHERARTKILNSIATRKGVSLLTSFTSLTQLGLNGLQASNQFLMDWTVGSQEAWAGEYYGLEESLWAGTQFNLEQRTIFSKLRYVGEEIFAKKFTPNKKLSKFLDWSEMSQSFGPNRGFGSGSQSKKFAEKGLGNLHILQEIPDLYMSSKKILALQRTYKGKLLDKAGNVIMNEDNEPADLLDVLIETKSGELKVDPRVANFDKTAYVSKVQAMLTKTTQLKGTFNRTLLERKAFGPLITLFRTWMVPNYRKRLGYGGGMRIDVESGALQEGYYTTTYNVLREVLANKGNISLLMQNTRSEAEKRNLKRMIHEIVMINISGIAATLFGMLLDNLDDDDDEQYWVAFATYQAMRLNTEYQSFSSYKEAIRVISSPTATTRSLENVANLTDIVINYATDNSEDNEVLYYQRKTGQYEKGDAKVQKYLKNISFGLSGIAKTQNPKDAIKYYDMFWGGDEYKLGEVIYEDFYGEPE